MKVRVAKQKRRGQTRWVVDWTDHSEKRHQPAFRTKEDAEAEAERIRITLRHSMGAAQNFRRTRRGLGCSSA